MKSAPLGKVQSQYHTRKKLLTLNKKIEKPSTGHPNNTLPRKIGFRNEMVFERREAAQQHQKGTTVIKPET